MRERMINNDINRKVLFLKRQLNLEFDILGDVVSEIMYDSRI